MKYPNEKRIGLTKFSLLRPKNCVWPGQFGQHQSCTCEIHENWNLLTKAILESAQNSIIEDDLENSSDQMEDGNIEKELLLTVLTDISAFTSLIVCKDATDLCVMGYCPICPKIYIIESLVNLIESDYISFKQWTRTDYTEIVTVTEDILSFRQRLEKTIPKVIYHHFIYTKQRDAIKSIKTDKIKNGTSAAIMVDFAQNANFIVQNSIQSRRFCFIS